MKKENAYILAFDPSLTAWGWALIQLDKKVIRVVRVGCIRTSPGHKKKKIRKGDDTVSRAGELIIELLRLVHRYDVKLIVTELPHGSQNASAAIMIGLCTGIVKTLGDCEDIPVEWYSEQDAKKCLLNKRSATKQQTIDVISKLYQVEWGKHKYFNEAVADAMAVFHVAFTTSEIIRFLMNEPK